MKNGWINGTAFHTPVRGELEVLQDALIAVDETGRIADVIRNEHPQHARIRDKARAEKRLVELGDSQFLVPGLVDLHIHAPQWPQLGKALDVPLEVWLQTYTFPLEARYGDTAFARDVYADLVATLLANGTTTAVYFATIHMEASLALAEICQNLGQRAFVGKVAMDDPEQCPEGYRDESASTAIADTRDFIRRVRGLCGEGAARVRPIITPRFLPSCTDELLDGLGQVAKESDCLIQTHCSESDWECDFVRTRFGQSDTEVLDRFGLLRAGTILAHSNFVSDGDLEMIRRADAAVAHCPLSNAYFAQAVFPLRAALDRHVHVGLGTDISGGHDPSVMAGCRHALMAARIRDGGVDPALAPEARGLSGSAITVPEAFWLATAGGGEALGLKVGRFAPGYLFDALVIDLDAPASNLRHWPDMDRPQDIFQKIVLNATRSNIAQVWVNGDRVAGETDAVQRQGDQSRS